MELPTLKDKSGVLTSVLCMLLLVSYHASRDALITVLPSISACTNNTTLPPPESRGFVLHPLAGSVRAGRGLRDEISKYFSGAKRLQGPDSPSNRLERGVESSPETPLRRNYSGIVDEVRGTTERNSVDGLEPGNIKRVGLEIQRKENEGAGTYAEDFSDGEVIEYIRTTLLEKGYDVGPSLVRELLNFQHQLDAWRSSRNYLNDSTDSLNLSTDALSASKFSTTDELNEGSLNGASDIDGILGSLVVTDGPEGGGTMTFNSKKDSVDGSGSGSNSGSDPGRRAGKDYDVNKSESTAPTMNKVNIVSEEQLLKLMRLLDYIDDGDGYRVYPTVREDVVVEEEKIVCDGPVFKNMTFLSSWQLAVQGSVLAGVHLTSIIGLFVGHYCIEGSTVQDSTVGAVFTLQVAVLLMVTELVTSLGAVALVAIRAWQGLVQGACYPVVYSLLENKKIHSRLVLGIIFTGPWLGSALGTSLGTQTYWAVTFYVCGAVVLAIGVLFIFLETTKIKPEVPCRWGEVMRRDVLVSCLMHGGAVWVLHTVMLASTLVVPPADRWWVLVLVLVGGGAVAQTLDVAIEPAIPLPGKPARSHLLITTVLSFSLTIAALMVLALEGAKEEVNMVVFVLVGGVVGSSFGYGVASIGYREVLEAVEGRRRSKALVLTNVAGASGASVACWLLFPMVQAGDTGGYISGCVFPLSAVSGGAVCVFMFLLFPKTPEIPNSEERQSGTPEGAGEDHPYGVYVIPTPDNLPTTQTRVPPDGMSQKSVDNRSFRSFKSFKSIMSTATFKTAMSRPRNASIATVYEDVEDGDLDDLSLECKSVALESCDDLQPGDGGLRKLEVQASYSDLLANGDRTSAWLQVHHNLDVPRRSSAGFHDPAVAPKPLPGLLF